MKERGSSEGESTLFILGSAENSRFVKKVDLELDVVLKEISLSVRSILQEWLGLGAS